MRITMVRPQSIAEELGIRPGDELLQVNGRRVMDVIDYRFYEADDRISLKVARGGAVVVYDIEKEEGEQVGIDFEDMKILACGNDCIFCFVDQNPQGLRKELYFRDGDFRLSFMYGNYTTLTNAGPAILRRIVAQRLSPQYISVHATDYDVRRRLMGLKKDDHILEKIRFLHDGGIDMHTQIVLCPGINDGDSLARTVHDLYEFNRRIVSLAIVPVGLTDHRFGLLELKRVDAQYAQRLLDRIDVWQERFREETGRAFVYPSDEITLVAGRAIPDPGYYDGFPQIENGVGIVRSFLADFDEQARTFPRQLKTGMKMTLATADLPAGFMSDVVLPKLRDVDRLDVSLEVVPNVLFGRNVTVAGLLSGKCLYSALKDTDCGDMLLLPPDVLNTEGKFLDDMTVRQLENLLDVPVFVFSGQWDAVFAALGGLRNGAAHTNSRSKTRVTYPVRVNVRI
jgi:putative radical SAM enzyme (TIGR03279 family)